MPAQCIKLAWCLCGELLITGQKLPFAHWGEAVWALWLRHKVNSCVWFPCHSVIWCSKEETITHKDSNFVMLYLYSLASVMWVRVCQGWLNKFLISLHCSVSFVCMVSMFCYFLFSINVQHVCNEGYEYIGTVLDTYSVSLFIVTFQHWKHASWNKVTSDSPCISCCSHSLSRTCWHCLYILHTWTSYTCSALHQSRSGSWILHMDPLPWVACSHLYWITSISSILISQE